MYVRFVVRHIKLFIQKYKRFVLVVLAILLGWFYFCLPDPLFKDPYSTVLNDKEGQLIGAKISSDGQWRFPEIEAVPKVFEDAILTFEDKRFRYHFGVDFISLIRAVFQNIKAGRVESGASTISMQVIRMSRKGKPRTVYQKVIEMILATRLEFRYSKDEIMRLYTSHAPFGGNVVGLDAACWRYFRKNPALLSSAEGAMLAVLPNAPSLIHISKNRKALLDKRNRLLKSMYEEGLLSEVDYELSLLEQIPSKPYPLPSIASHLLEYVHKTNPGKSINSTIDSDVQRLITEVGNFHHMINKQSDIHNIGILVMDTKTGQVIGYLGNAPNTQQEKSVDMVQAKRSSGSVLKPILYAHLIDEGKLMPKALLKDIPTQIRGFSPENYNRKYSGAAPADQALAKSLNIPAVYNLQHYGVGPFLNRLADHGFTTFNKSADYYGLSLILGGGEVTLWELCNVYANMGRTLIEYNQNEGKYSPLIGRHPLIENTKKSKVEFTRKPTILSAGAIYKTFEAMLRVIRPGSDGEWEQFNSSKPIAWKTGTSYGHRDAWAIGVSPDYTVGVWVGNADGEGKNGLIGVSKAGPILFDVYNRMEGSRFFDEPLDDLVPTMSCKQSGYLASQYCDEIDTIYSISYSQNTKVCPYHRRIHTDGRGKQVTSRCVPPSEMIHLNHFELPPAMAYYYKKNHPEYKSVPLYRKECLVEANEDVMSFIYPVEKSKLFLPMDIDGIQEKAVFKAAHQNISMTLYWHLDNRYIGYTKEFHTIEVSGSIGDHTITIVDELGNRIQTSFEIVR